MNNAADTETILTLNKISQPGWEIEGGEWNSKRISNLDRFGERVHQQAHHAVDIAQVHHL